MEVEELTRALELDIVFGRLRPRERLVEDDLIARFRAKRHIVRSALATLEQLGMVDRRPHRGASVRDYSPEEVAELYDMRDALHRLAVERMPLPLTRDRIEALRGIQARHGAAIEKGDLPAVLTANNAFHDMLFDACGNRYLAEAIRRHGLLAHAIRSYRIADREMLEQARREHEEMIEAAGSGDRARLSILCRRHIEPSKAAYLRGRLDTGGFSRAS